ncbi:dTMP kinase [Brytella acorum]|uniref:Thymidylate kinase n=1 Tax=Brytella acorum TaxID=2959299 RepID=A0AA35XVE9_9PROT|nr:dTMP kinase [Brytella acorum]MDF3624479.1 dTMP kinase [Brytella acorum]CAI9119671.1 dTMP kinase [Brytella acorum]
MSDGLFITFEGGEGAGKTTQSRLLAERLRQAGHEVVLTREPGGTPGAEALREVLLFGAAPLSWKAQVLGHMAARADHIDNLIRPAIERGAVVVCDRFHDSTVTYQGYGVGRAEQAILSFIADIRRLLAFEPDLTFLLTVPLETGMDRLAARGGRTDRYEAESVAFHERVEAGFAAIAAAEPVRMRVVNGVRAPDEVAQTIYDCATACLEARLKG